MGVTIESKNYSVDIGYGGFNRFRGKVATLASPKFGEHYTGLVESVSLFGEDETKDFFKKYDSRTKTLIESGEVPIGVANFCHQSDCEGSVSQEQAKQIYEKIKGFDDEIAYGYIGRPDCAMFSDLKQIFKDCAVNGGIVEWW